MSDGPLELLAVFALRLLQAALLSLPTLLLGMLCAGVLRVVVGEATVRRWLNRGGTGDLVRAALLAVVLPVCAVGVLPVVGVLAAMRVRVASLAVVLLVGPLVTPWTLGYLADTSGLIEATTLLLLASCCAAIVGRVAERVTRRNAPASEPAAIPRSLVGVAVAAGRSLTPTLAVVALLAWVGAAAIAVLIPANGMGEWLADPSTLHVALLAAVPMFTYAWPDRVAMQAGLVLHASALPGMVVPLAWIAASCTLGTLLLAWRYLGGRGFAAAVATLLVVAAAATLAVQVAFPTPAGDYEDTHAFEDHGRPFHLLDHPDGAAAGFVHRLGQPVTTASAVAGVGIAALLLIRRRPLAAPADVTEPPPRWLAPAALVATLAMAAVGYLPSPTQIERDLRRGSADLVDALRRDDPARAGYEAWRIEQRLRQAKPAMALRLRSLDAEQRAAIDDARALLRSLLDRATPPSPQDRLAFVAAIGGLRLD